MNENVGGMRLMTGEVLVSDCFNLKKILNYPLAQLKLYD